MKKKDKFLKVFILCASLQFRHDRESRRRVEKRVERGKPPTAKKTKRNDTIRLSLLPYTVQPKGEFFSDDNNNKTDSQRYIINKTKQASKLSICFVTYSIYDANTQNLFSQIERRLV